MLKAIFGSGEPEAPKDRKTYRTDDPKAMAKLFEELV